MRTNKGNGKILVVEDEDITRIVLQDMLTSMNFESVSARDGLEAIEIYSHSGHEIDLVILDLNMPRLNGKDTYFKLLEINKNVKVILSTGDTENEAIDHMKEKGLEHVLKKPYQFDILENILNNIN